MTNLLLVGLLISGTVPQCSGRRPCRPFPSPAHASADTGVGRYGLGRHGGRPLWDERRLRHPQPRRLGWSAHWRTSRQRHPSGQAARATPPLNLADDAGLQTALEQARASGLPHRILLADHIESIIEDKRYDDAKAFRTGLMAVLRHSNFSTDLALGELYLRMLQQHVKDDILDDFDAAGRILIDGAGKDWPRESIMIFPKPSKKPGKGKSRDELLLKGFGAIRGQESLFVIYQTNKKIEFGSKAVFTLEIRKLTDHFTDTAYKVNIINRRIRLFNGQGDEIPMSQDDPIELKAKRRTLELRIPLGNFEKDLRSIAVRGSLADPPAKRVQPPAPRSGLEPAAPAVGPASRAPAQREARSLWVACPTGPVTEPTEMLIHFAVQRELPLGNGLPVAIALQEGLLMANSHPDLAKRIKKDAYAWMELALDIDEQLDEQGLRPVSKLPVAAQLAWACRYDGRQVFNAIEEYEFHVAQPGTIGDLRSYAEVRGWLGETSPAELRGNIAKMMADDFKVFDYPNQKAREQGSQFADTRKDAYFVKGKEKLLCYRDVGINQRWKFLEEGFGLKGNPRQAVEFQRLLSIAAGLPTLRASHHSRQASAAYTISFDGKKHKWFPTGAPSLNTTRKAKLNFLWHKPWTRPERFDVRVSLTRPLPTGPARFFLQADYQEFSAKRLQAMLEKGISEELLAESILAPLRMRQ